MELNVRCGREMFRTFLLLFISCFVSSNEYNFTDESGIIESPSTSDTGTFIYNIFPYMDTTVRVQSIMLNLSDPQEDFGCIRGNFIALRTAENEKYKYFCYGKVIEAMFTAKRIIISFNKESDSRAYFKLSYKACSQVLSESVGTISSDEEFHTSRTDLLSCYFEINVTSSVMIFFTGDDGGNCEGFLSISAESVYPEICNLGKQTIFIEKGPVIIRYNGTGDGVRANYTDMSKNDLHKDFRDREGNFGPQLFFNKYAKNANYTFTITSDNDGRLLIYFLDADFGQNCTEKLHVNDIVLCRENISHVTIFDEEVKVSFVTDFTGSGTGFEGYWTTCGGQYDGPFGSINQPVLNASSHEQLFPKILNCTYNITIQYAENIFFAINSTSDVLHIQEKDSANGVHDGNNLVFEYRAKSGTITPFLVYFIGCPRIFSQAGNITLNSTFTSLIPAGFNCSFILKNTSNKTMTVSVYVKYANNSVMTDSSKSSDKLHIEYQEDNNHTELVNVTGKHTFISYGNTIITYISGEGTKLEFEASYNFQNEVNDQSDRNGSDEHGTMSEEMLEKGTSDPTIPIIVGSIVAGVLIVAATVFYCYRRKTVSEGSKSTSKSSKKSSSRCSTTVTNDDNCNNANAYTLAGTYAEIRLDNTGKGVIVEEEDNTGGKGVIAVEEGNKADIATVSKPEVEQNQCNNSQVNPAPKCEYSTPWDAKSERDKITKVLAGSCPDGNKDGPATTSEIVNEAK